ncbi:tRNA pseudouridine(13) synthase TruD [Thermogymnomonas acidicola]|uniref:Probable tRNA pseudouridine synthase D n=1 Tax=Thermogymnomonas acidicola TaxID=399579 RepID=A0AA37BPV0_9ARCH|nr:tRNA pseudouridine(13) synthase TruD [Thermogymnomonas acidicola]
MVASIKESPEDFVVEEIPLGLEPSEAGRYWVLKVRLRSWDTNAFLIELADRLRISRKRITYAGTKDKHGITTQYFCINAPVDPGSIRIRDAEILEWFRTDRMLRLGDLVGNRFRVRISSASDLRGHVEETVREMLSKGGFPNFFGLQRFGSLRTNTHTVGKLLVAGDYEGAARRYLYDPELDTDEFRISFGQTGDMVRAMAEYPQGLKFERAIIGYALEHGTLLGAFNALPRNLAMMFVHAYQSYLFNLAVSRRLSDLGSLTEPLIGDICVPVDRYSNPSGNFIRVDRYNIEKIGRLCGEGRVRITAFLPGYSYEAAGGYQGELEAHILDSEGVSPGDFRVKGYPELSSSGSRRPVIASPVGFSFSGDNTLEFALGRGIYATSLIREIIKGCR